MCFFKYWPHKSIYQNNPSSVHPLYMCCCNVAPALRLKKATLALEQAAPANDHDETQLLPPPQEPEETWQPPVEQVEEKRPIESQKAPVDTQEPLPVTRTNCHDTSFCFQPTFVPNACLLVCSLYAVISHIVTVCLFDLWFTLGCATHIADQIERDQER